MSAVLLLIKFPVRAIPESFIHGLRKPEHQYGQVYTQKEEE
jgi:hypothetical protein